MSNIIWIYVVTNNICNICLQLSAIVCNSESRNYILYNFDFLKVEIIYYIISTFRIADNEYNCKPFTEITTCPVLSFIYLPVKLFTWYNSKGKGQRNI